MKCEVCEQKSEEIRTILRPFNLHLIEPIGGIRILSEALSEARDEIKGLEGVEKALRNCQMVAAREVRRHDTGKAIKATAMTYAAWKHILRFCEEAGVLGSILRGPLGAASK